MNDMLRSLAQRAKCCLGLAVSHKRCGGRQQEKKMQSKMAEEEEEDDSRAEER